MARALREIGIEAEACVDHFPGRHDDEEWIALCAQNGWIAITADREARRRQNERLALAAAGVTVVFCAADVLRNRDGIEQTGWFCTHFRALLQEICRHPRGSHFRINARGEITVLYVPGE